MFINVILHKLDAGVDEDKHKRQCEILIKFLLWSGIILKPLHLLLVLIMPEMPAFPSSLHTPVTTTALVAWVLPMMYVIYTSWSNMLFLGAHLLAYIYATLDALNDLK